MARQRQPSISDAEWQVMEAVWAGAPATANEIIDRLSGRGAEWNPRTIRTMLNRLVGKRALGYTADGKRYLYTPLVDRADCVRDESRSFLSRVFGGAAGAALVHFVEEHDLTPDEIEQLKQVLRRKGR
jgi:BlaI family transcriptional regulator, penicillinase repressor